MDGMFDQLVRIAWMQCWQVTLLIVLVGGLVWCFGRSRPHLASVLWLLVIVKCLTPPVWSSPSGIFCWLQPVTNVAAVETSPPVQSAFIAQRNDDEIVVQLAANESPQEAWIAPKPLPAPNRRMVQQASIDWSRTLATALVVAWFGGLLMCVLWMIRRWQTCWRQIRAGQVEPTSELNELLSDLQQRLKIRRQARLLITSSAVGPAVVGLWRPTIVLPSAIVESKQQQDIELLLAHELVHIRRGDLWVAVLQLSVQCLWWFHPLVRWANEWLTRETERSCDEEVIGRLGCQPAAYARSLLNVLELKQQLQPVPTFPGVRPVDVTKQRLERIMQLGQGCRRSTPWWCWVIMAVLALITLPGAAILVRAKDPRASASKSQTVLLPNLTMALGDDPVPTDSQAELTTATYDVLDLLQKLEADVVERPAEAAKYLESILLSVIQANAGSAKDPSFGWRNGQIVIKTTAAGHRIAAEQLALYRQSGFAQYVFEVRLLQGPPELRQAVKAEWQAIQPKPDGDLDRFGIAMDGEGANGLESTVNRRQPVITALFDEPQMQAFMKQAQVDKDTNFVCAPKITTFNGQSVRIESLERRPFVVAVKEVAVKEVAEKAYQPEIRVVDVGWKMRLRARGTKGDKIKVDFARADSEISKVELRDVFENVAVQIPQVAVNRLQTQFELLPNQTYVLGGLESLADPAKPAHLWLLVTVRKIDEAEIQREERGDVKKDDAPRIEDVYFPEDRGVQPEKMTKLYNVADLALSLAQIRSVGFNDQITEAAARVSMLADGRLKLQPAKKPELDSADLIELITTTIEPDMWAEVGGEGTVEYVPQQGSLLVSQYEWVHDKIADLLETLRNFQRIKVVLSLKQVWIPMTEWQKLAADPQHLEKIAAIEHWQGFESFNAAQLDAILKHDVRKNAAVTRTVTYNGQPISIEAPAGEDGKFPVDRLRTLHLFPMIAGDWSHVRLGIAPQSNPEIEAKLPALNGAAAKLNTATTLVLDLDRTDWQCKESKLLPLATYAASDKSLMNPEYRRLLTVTADVFTTEDGIAKHAKEFSIANSEAAK